MNWENASIEELEKEVEGHQQTLNKLMTETRQDIEQLKVELKKLLGGELQ